MYFSRISQLNFISLLPLKNLILYFTEIYLPEKNSKTAICSNKIQLLHSLSLDFSIDQLLILSSVLDNPKCYHVPQISVPKVVVVSLGASGMAENGTVGQGGAAVRWKFEKFIKLLF